MSKSKVQPLATERRPASPKSRITSPPPGAVAHPVKLGEDWHTLAQQYGFLEITLMEYNFGTHEPAEVNWYLREYVGCVLQDERRNNWKFSNDAKPGIIYIPPREYDFGSAEDPTELLKGKPPFKGVDWAVELAKAGSKFSGGPHKRVLALEIGHLVVVGLEIAEAHVVLLQLGVLVAPVAAQVALLAAIGGASRDGRAIRAIGEARDGYAMGVVLGANGADPKYVEAHYKQHHTGGVTLRDTRPDYRRGRPNTAKHNVYNVSLASGYITAKQLDPPQRKELFQVLHSRMPADAIPNKPWKSWDERQKRNYYNNAAIAFKIMYTRP
jgi:hypothetical protein